MPDQRYLANYLLHASAIPYPGAAANVTKEGKVVLWIPDRLKKPAWSVHAFSYHEDRDGVSLAHEMLDAIVEFMDAMMVRFKHWQDNRFTPPDG